MTTAASSTAPQARLVYIASIIVIIAGIKAAEAVVVPFFLALMIAIICTGPLHLLERLHVPRLVALVLVLCMLAAIGGALFTVAGTAVVDFTNQIPAYRSQLRDWMASLQEFFAKQGWTIPEKSMDELLNADDVFRLVRGLFTGLGQALNNFLVLLVIVAFLLLEGFGFYNKVRSGLREPETALQQLQAIALTVKQFLVIKTVVSVILAALVLILLQLWGVPNAILWALLAFVLNYIPIFGALLASIPPILITLIGRSWESAAIVAGGYLVITTVLFNVVEPALMGRRLGLSPLAIILSIFFWGWLFGPVGMLLAVPIMMAIKISFECQCEGHWLPALLGAEAPAHRVRANATRSSEALVLPGQSEAKIELPPRPR